MRTLLLAALLTAFAVPLQADDLTLDEAISYAKAHNGVLGAAVYQRKIAQSSVTVANAAFWPTIFPEYRWSDQRRRLSANGSDFSLDSDSLSARADWLILDGGQRGYSLARARKLSKAAEYSLSGTLKGTIFSVIQDFYETVRAQELLRVADATVGRAKQTLDVTKNQVDVGATPRKDILQAEADLANAQVSQISAKNAISVAGANLKSVLGWKEGPSLPTLVAPETLPTEPIVASVEEAVQIGTAQRPDLQEARERLAADRYSVLTAERQATLDWTLNFSFAKNFDPDREENQNLTFLLSYPLFDAGVAREIVRQADLGLKANRLLLEQQVRDAASEIEATFLAYQADRERLAASESALKAAQVNFQAATESQAEGVASVIDVTSAQLTLITAETNYVEALYDAFISDAALRLAIGAKLPGE